MNPDDFLTLAIKLSNSSGEAERRSAVSRAYYGAFHRARALVDSCDVTLPRHENIHRNVVRCLQHSDDADVVAAGGKLDSFRATRNAADYQLNDRQFTNPKFIQLQLAIARDINDSIASAIPRIAVIRPCIRKHARDVEKLALRGHD